MVVSFGVGSAWGAMGILLPLVGPLMWELSPVEGRLELRLTCADLSPHPNPNPNPNPSPKPKPKPNPSPNPNPDPNTRCAFGDVMSGCVFGNVSSPLGDTAVLGSSSSSSSQRCYF